MNYQNKIKGLFKEAFRGVNYSRIPIALRVLTAIIHTPLILLAFASYAVFNVFNFFYRITAAPCEYLELWVDEKKKSTHWLAEAVILFITTPFIFFLRILLSLYSVTFEIIWFSMLIETFLATLGSVRWQPYIMDAEYDQKYTWELKNNENFVKIYSITPIIFAFMTVMFYMVFEICRANYLSVTDYQERLTAWEIYNIMYIIHNVFVGITAIFVCIINPIVFQKKNITPISETITEKNCET